jgi:hypothetical protein
MPSGDPVPLGDGSVSLAVVDSTSNVGDGFNRQVAPSVGAIPHPIVLVLAVGLP